MWSRETRLLLLTMAASGVVLLLLAQFRFPDVERRVEPPAQPLERLAARATFDELASIIARLERRIAPSLVMLRVGSRAPHEPRTLDQLLARSGDQLPAPAFVPALRVRADLAVAFLDSHSSVYGVLGDDAAVPLVIASDPLKRIALVRVPPPTAGVEWNWASLDDPTVPRYVASAEGSRGGVTLRPIFLGRADRFEEPRWESPLLVLGNASVAAEGAFVFSMDGELVGLVVTEAGIRAVVPATTLTATAEALVDSGSRPVVDFGVALRALDPALVQQFGVTSGVVVASVAPKSLSDGRLRAGDVIESVNGVPAGSPDAVLFSLAGSSPGATVIFGIRRDAKAVSVSVPVPVAVAP